MQLMEFLALNLSNIHTGEKYHHIFLFSFLHDWIIID